MRTFHCHCGNIVHFENTRCLACGRVLGFLPEPLTISAFEPAANNRWRALHPDVSGQHFRMCENYSKENVCNWMVTDDAPETFCRACRLNRMIPNLMEQRNRVLWSRIEQAKRRLLYTLTALKLPIISRQQDPVAGLAFEFLEDSGAGGEFADDFGYRARVLTGHRAGLITINIAEADPGAIETMRERMQEEYRTLLGHFRHEIGHYYWDRLVRGGFWLAGFRTLFGDEGADYGQSLQRYYEQGPPADWQQNYISAYASSHPWEDWAETWSHYLHMVDTLDTAYDFGFAIGGRPLRAPTAETPAVQLTSGENIYTESFDDILADWSRLTIVLNALNRSIGQRDAYPFVLAPGVAGKLRFLHGVIRDTRTTAT